MGQDFNRAHDNMMPESFYNGFYICMLLCQRNTAGALITKGKMHVCSAQYFLVSAFGSFGEKVVSAF
jgi:hypothetical protein